MTQLLDYLSEKYPQDSVDEVNRRLLELSSLFEISQLINESLELNRVLNNVLLIPMGRMMVPRCAIVLKMGDHYEVVMSKGLPPELQETRFAPEDFPPACHHPQKFDQIAEKCPPRLREFVEKARLKVGLPFLNNNQLLGFMMFGGKLSGQEFSLDEIHFLNSLANLSASTIANALQVQEIKQINRQLDEKVQELKTLFDIGQGLSATLESEKILRLLVYALMGQMLITRYAVLLKTGAGIAIHDSKGFLQDFLQHIGGLLDKTTILRAPVCVSDFPDEKLRSQFQKSGVEVVIPMQHQEKVLGHILLGAKINGQSYSATDLEFMSTLVSQAVISLENARLFQETLEKQRLEEELSVARTIQKKLLPRRIPLVPGYDIYGMNNSSRQVGGDYYDVIPVDERRVALAIGDVSGKGIPAALLMANLQAALRVMMDPRANIAEVVGRLNNLIYANTEMDKFITFFLGILDFDSHTLEYVNAGHNNPVHLQHNRELGFLDVGGLILGILPNYQYKTGKITLEKGDLLLAYTDGVNEAINSRGEEWGEAPLYALLQASRRRQSCQEIVTGILREIEIFSKGEPQADDVTMLAIRRLE